MNTLLFVLWQSGKRHQLQRHDDGVPALMQKVSVFAPEVVKNAVVSIRRSNKRLGELFMLLLWIVF